LVLINWI